MRERELTQFMQCTRVDVTLEVDDFPNRLPVIHPSPTIELWRLIRGIEPQQSLGGAQAQQIPTLFLTHAQGGRITSDEGPRKPVSQPASGLTQHLDVMWPESDLLVELAKQRVVTGFSVAHAPLRELPATTSAAPAQKQLSVRPHKDDPDIHPVALAIDEINRRTHHLPCTICQLLVRALVPRIVPQPLAAANASLAAPLGPR